MRIPRTSATCADLAIDILLMDEKTVKEVLTGAFSKVLSALQNPVQPGTSSQTIHRHDEPLSVSRAPQDSDDDEDDFEVGREKKKRQVVKPS